MKHYICRTTTELPGYMQAQINITGDELIAAGYVFDANELEDVSGNISVYELIPGAYKEGTLKSVLKYFLIGFGVMILSHLLMN